MTPIEQDKELLEKQIHKLFGDGQAYDGGYHSCYDGKWIDMTNEVCAVADFVTADRKRIALEARLDEMDVALAEVTHWSIDDADSAIHGYGEYRIDKLKRELDKL